MSLVWNGSAMHITKIKIYGNRLQILFGAGQVRYRHLQVTRYHITEF